MQRIFSRLFGLALYLMQLVAIHTGLEICPRRPRKGPGADLIRQGV